MVPHAVRLAKGYGKHRTTIQRSILFLLLFRSVLAMRRIVKSIKKSNADDAKSTTLKQNKVKTEKKKVEVNSIKLKKKKVQIYQQTPPG